MLHLLVVLKLLKANLEDVRVALSSGYGVKQVKINEDLDSYDKVQMIKIVDPSDKGKNYNCYW